MGVAGVGQIILVGLFLVLSLGCAEKKATPSHDIILEAYRLIDENRDDEAILLLENKLINEPANYECTVVLASAYAHKAGFKIQKLIPVFQKSSEMKRMREEAKKNSRDLQSLGIDPGVLDMTTMLYQFSNVLGIYALLPTIEKPQSIYIVHAIYLLNGLGSRIQPEDVIYRVLLQIVMFKYYTSEKFVGDLSITDVQVPGSCKIDFVKVSDSIVELGKLLIDILHDIGYADPRQAEDMKVLALQTSDSISNLTMALGTMTAMDETTLLFLKQAVLQNGFGKIFKCGGN